MKTPEQLKRETTELLRQSRDARLRKKNALRDMILDLHDRLSDGQSMPSDAQPASRHAPKLTVVR